MLLNKYPETNGNINYIFYNGDSVLIKSIKSNNKISNYIVKMEKLQYIKADLEYKKLSFIINKNNIVNY